MTFPHWLGKAYRGDDFCDVIFSSGNGVCRVDDLWFEHSVPARVLGDQSSDGDDLRLVRMSGLPEPGSRRAQLAGHLPERLVDAHRGGLPVRLRVPGRPATLLSSMRASFRYSASTSDFFGKTTEAGSR